MNNLISEYISTRICHDIIGNIGAVSNAVELLEDNDTEFMDDIKSILKTSSAVLTARMKFFRLAFGLDNSGIKDLPLITDTIKNYLLTVGGKNPPQVNINLSHIIFGKIILLLTMIMADLMIKGGTIHIAENNNKLIIGIQEDTRIAEDKLKQLLNIINGDHNQISAQDAPILYLQELCLQQGVKLRYTTSPVLYFIVE